MPPVLKLRTLVRSTEMKKAAVATAPGNSVQPRNPIKNPVLKQCAAWCNQHDGLCFLGIAALWVLALYWKALDAPFVYDDLEQIANNPALRSWHATFARFFLAPVAFTAGLLNTGGSTYRPVYWLTLALDTHLWGQDHPAGFHLTNLLFHWLNGALFYRLLRRLRTPALTAAAAALLWLGLPINTEAVAWVSGRAYLLSTFFLLLALLSALSCAGKPKPVALVSYFALALGAVFSHELGFALLPLTLLLLYAVSLRNPRTWIHLIGTASLAAVLYELVKILVGAQGAHGSISFWPIALEFWKYLSWMLAPVHMSVERSTSLPPAAPSLAAAAAWCALAALLGAAVLLRKKQPGPALGLAAGCIALLPFCGLVPLYQGMAERFLYLASLGFIFALVSIVIASRSMVRRAAVALLVLWTAWGAWRLTQRVLDWNNPVDLYQNSLRATPASPTLYYNLGFSLREQGSLGGALEAYRQAIRLRPNYPQAFASIGDIDQQLGKPAEALAAYAHALTLQPNDPKTVINYAITLSQTGNQPLAEQQFKRVIALAPNDSAAYIDLGALLSQQDREDEAIQSFQKAIALTPENPDPYFDLAVMFQQKGQDDLALPFYKKVLALKPGDPDTLLYVSKLHIQRPD